MANPTKGWDKVPVFGWYMELDGVTPKVGTVKLTLAQRVTSTDGRTIFPGGTITATLGGTDNDTAVLNQIRAAMSAVDQAAVEAGGGTFDAAAWGADWDARLPGAFFTSFPASDDPDIVEDGFQVKVEEKLASGDGKIYYITPLLADLGNPIPGVNLGTIAVPPGAPTAPAPIYQKGQPGGVASLDDTGVVPLAQIPSGIGGASTWSQLTDKPAVIAAGATEQEALDAIGAAAAADVVPDTRTVNGKPLSADVVLGASDVSAVPTTRTVNGKPLSADVALVAGDVGAVPTTRTVAGKPLSGDVALVAGDVGAVPTTRTVAGKALSADVPLAKTDVGLGNVDDTSDLNKPISTAAQNALNAKEPSIAAGSTAQFRRGDKTWQTLNAAAIIDATTPGKALMTAADVNSVRAVSNIYELGATDSPSTLGLPPGSWILRLPVPTLVEPTRDGFNYQNGVPASGQVVTATADSTLVAGSWMAAVYTGNGAMGTVVAPSGWAALMPRTTVGTLDMCVYAKIADSTDASAKSFAFSSGANAANSSLMLLWGSGADVVSNWIIGTVENRATAGGAFANIAPSLTTTKDKTLVLALSGERTAAVDSTAPTVTGATAWVNGPESQTLQLQTTEVAYIDQTTAGATGNVTITYPNTHATNGLALQIAIPAT